MVFFFFFNDTATTEIYTLSLHDALPIFYPDNDLSYTENFLSMMFKMTEVKYEPDPRLARALDVLWILHADHEQNCSTAAVRGVGSSQVDPRSEEHTSELQSRQYLVCRLLLEKKKNNTYY